MAPMIPSPDAGDQATPEPLSPERLAEIRERARAATEGPWGTYDDGTGLIDIAAELQDTGHGYRCRRYIGQLEVGQIDNDPAHADWDEDQDCCQVEADAEFIAHSRQDVPDLLAEVDRLWKRVAELNHQRAVALAPHEQYPDSAHCKTDGEPWPCALQRAFAEAGEQS